MAEQILPGVYIEVRPEALIVGGPVSVGNIGIVGTAEFGPVNEAQVLGSYADAISTFGPYDAFDAPEVTNKPLTLVRALEIAYRHGASKVFAVRVAGPTPAPAAPASLGEVKRDRIPVVGSRPAATPINPSAFIAAAGTPALESDRVIYVMPGIKANDAAAKKEVTLPGAYAAAAIAGMLSARAPHISLTNKVLNVGALEVDFNAAQLSSLVQAGVLALEHRRGQRVVKGITTDPGAFQQITTRRIVDFAKFGVRAAAEPYIGLLNNDRVRKALKGSINGFLADMVTDEMLESYDLDVTATRDDEIRGIARVTMTVRPTFSIDFIKVVMFLG